MFSELNSGLDIMVSFEHTINVQRAEFLRKIAKS